MDNKKNNKSLDEELTALRNRLSSPELHQKALFDDWPASISDLSESQYKVLLELYNFASVYSGGIEQYIANAELLLNEPDVIVPSKKKKDTEEAQGNETKVGLPDYTDLDLPTYLFHSPPLWLDTVANGGKVPPQQVRGAFTDADDLNVLERRGTQLMKECAFVLVAGGVGERLGFSDVKVHLPVETTSAVNGAAESAASRRSSPSSSGSASAPAYPSSASSASALSAASFCYYLKYYCQWIRQTTQSSKTPFIIMTSEATHGPTEALLAEINSNGNNDAGEKAVLENVILMKQQEVFCFKDSDANLCLELDKSSMNYRLPKKPHGHGDVHSLLYKTKFPSSSSPGGSCSLMSALKNQFNTKYVVFLQDTNAPAVFTIPISLALSEREDLAMNVTCIQREENEAIGILAKARCSSNPFESLQLDAADGANADANHVNDPMTKKEVEGDSSGEEVEYWRTVIIEYNVYEEIANHNVKENHSTMIYQLLNRKQTEPDAAGGVDDQPQTAYSPFPGSINTLILDFEKYYDILEATEGNINEFINPKYENETKRTFKSPARLESLMQDIILYFNCVEVEEGEGGEVLKKNSKVNVNKIKEKVGGTVFDRLLYQPVKNNIRDIFKKLDAHGSVERTNTSLGWSIYETHGATSAEIKYYEFMRRRLNSVGIQFKGNTTEASSGSDICLYNPFYSGESNSYTKDEKSQNFFSAQVFPNIVLDPIALGDFTLRYLKENVFPFPERVHITKRSTLIIEGNVRIESLYLDGALKIIGPRVFHGSSSSSNVNGNVLVIRDLEVRSKHWSIKVIPAECYTTPSVPADETDGGTGEGKKNKEFSEIDLMRGFVFERNELKVIDSNTDLSKL